MLIGFISVSAPTFAAPLTDASCRSYAYGFMADGKVYMMLAGKKYGPFEDMNQLKITLTRLGPQFRDNLKRYMLLETNGSAEKYLVYRDEIGECNPYELDMDTVADWNLKITDLFRKLNVKFWANINAYRTALYGAIDKVNTKIASGQGSQKTIEILKLIRDRFQKRMENL